MNAVCIYVSTAQLVLQTDSVDAICQQRLLDLNRLLPHLRQLLSCVVCCRLLNDPYAPRHGRCQHNVCRLCVRGRKSLRPYCATCKDCQDFKTYDENRQMHCLLLCYKSLCEHLMGSVLFPQLSKQKPANVATLAHANDPCIPLPQMSTQEFVLEGASYDDITAAFQVDLARTSVLPRIQLPTSAAASVLTLSHTPLSTSAATPLAPSSGIHSSMLHTQSISKAATPPRNSTLPLSTPPPPPPPPPSSHKKDTVTTTLPYAVATSHATLLTATSSVTPAKSPALPTFTPTLTIKSIKPAAVHNNNLLTSSSCSVGSLAPPSITYMGTNTPGVVVPIVSSSATTTAPLSIASAKVQSLHRQLAQARSALNANNSSDGQAPLTFKVSMPSGVTLTPSTSVAPITTIAAVNPTTATVTSQQIRNPPPIKTVSNGSAMYSVLYTGVGNKITIKRKTDGDEDAAQRKNASTSAPPPTVFRQMAKTNNVKRRGCRCGNATPTPGKLTCCGQRCPCYVDSKSCIGCKCRGCRNPHRPDGGKVRPVIPELDCYEIQMADESSSLSPNELPIATTMPTTTAATATPSPPTGTALPMPTAAATTTTSSITTNVEIQSVKEFNSVTAPQVTATLPPLNMASTTTTSTATLIPLRNLQQFAVAAHQHQQHHPHQQLHTQSHGQTHTHTQTPQLLSNNATVSGSGLQLEGLQRESVLIQNVEGKYQVVNVFTTTSAAQAHQAANSSNQMTHLQRAQSISQLQNVTSNNSCSGSNASAFLLPNVSSCASGSSIVGTTPHTTNLSQIIVQSHSQQPQQQQHQHQPVTVQTAHLQPRITVTSTIANTGCGSHNNNNNNHHHHHHNTNGNNNNSNAHLPLQVQQQLKQNNIITVHPISNSGDSSVPSSGIPLMAAAANAASNATITLSPIIMASPNTFATTDMFSDSSEDFTSIKSGVLTSNSCSSASPSSSLSATIGSTPQHILTVPLAQGSPLTLRTSSAPTTVSAASVAANTHLTPAMVEVFESNDLRLLQANGFVNY